MPVLSPLEKVRAFFTTAAVPSGGLILVAVSGGPDSVCLLHVLFSLRKMLCLRLHVAHLDHQLRGAESSGDAAYVKELAERLGLPVTISGRDVEAYRRRHRLSLEEAAREVRYEFLEETARQAGAYAAAVGHTADDRIETVIMNLLRGTGTRGLRGLLPVSRRDNGKGLTILRPLLEVSREETVAYCRENKLHPRTDASNLSQEFLRNRVRHTLIPALRDYNPRVEEALLRTARITADDIEFIESEVERIRNSVISVDKGAVILDKSAFAPLHPALQRGILRAAVMEVRGSLKDIEAGHIEDMLSAAHGPSGKMIVLPEGLYFSIEYTRFVLSTGKAPLCPLPELDGEYPLTVPGTTQLPGWEVTAALVALEQYRSAEQGDLYTAWLDYDITGQQLAVRGRRRGDRFRPLGLGAEKKLGEFMLDEHIPRAWRDRVPVVASPEHIIWVAGSRIDERARVTEQTTRILRLVFRRTGVSVSP